MDGISVREWWQTKGVFIANNKIVNLIGNNIGYMPFTNLFSEEELVGINSDDLFSIIDDLNHDGLDIREVYYTDGSKELKCLIR